MIIICIYLDNVYSIVPIISTQIPYARNYYNCINVSKLSGILPDAKPGHQVTNTFIYINQNHARE